MTRECSSPRGQTEKTARRVRHQCRVTDTIGIEHEGGPGDDWPDVMYAASAALLRDLGTRFPALSSLSRRNVVMHREIRADKTCPGSKVDLSRRLLEAGGPPVDQPDLLRARSRVNVRRGQPSTSAPVVRVIPVGELVNVRSTERSSPQGTFTIRCLTPQHSVQPL